jgi:DNA ligase 1
MQAFAALFDALDASTATNDKVAALAAYFAAAPAADAAWAVYFLAGGKPRQVVPTAVLRDLACQRAGVDDWLFEACYQAVGDLAETIAHILPPAAQTNNDGLAHWVEERLLPLRGLPPTEQHSRLNTAFDELGSACRFLLVKLIGGGFRVGVSKLLVQRALAQITGLDGKLVTQRLVGWTDSRCTPSAARWSELVAPPEAGAAASRGGQPYPFFLAHALQAAPETLGAPEDWLVEWKYDGIRAQVVKRDGQVWLWSRGEELITERFPEVVALAAGLPNGTVLDGEILAWLPDSETPAPFQLLQQRITRKTLSKKLLLSAPVRFMAYDLLENAGLDCREQAQHQRRRQLQTLLTGGTWSISPQVQSTTWAELASLQSQARERGVEGLMLKHQQSRYGSGRTKSDGTWWKWKVAPLCVDYTFAVWSRAPVNAEEALGTMDAIARKEPAQQGSLQLLPFAKAYSGLTDAEFKAVDKVIRATTIDKFGPVRSVRPSLVFEIGFEGIGASPRHKSGVAVRFPRMLRLRPDKPLHEADSLATLLALIGDTSPK